MTKKLEVFIREEALDAVKDALQNIGIVGMNVFEVRGHGRRADSSFRGVEQRTTWTSSPRCRSMSFSATIMLRRPWKPSSRPHGQERKGMD